MPWPVAEVLADLHHDNRTPRVKSLQKWPIEIPKLDFRILSLSEFNLQQQNITGKQNVDVWLTKVSPRRVGVPNPLIIVNSFRLREVPLKLTQDSPLIGLAFGSSTFESRLFTCPRAILQNLAISQALNPMIRIRRLGHQYLPEVLISFERAHLQSTRPAQTQTLPLG